MKLAALFAAIALPISSLALVGTAHAQISGGGDADDIARDLEATTDEEVAPDADPWEGFNRKMFAVNDALDRNVMVPVAKGYRAITHKKQRKGIRNFLHNLRTPVILINDLLQGEFERAGETAGRFVINSTIGFAGMGDPAERLGIEQHSEDFGQTLAVWGVKPGPYLVLPFLGPTTVRDGFGAGVQLTMDPAFWMHGKEVTYFQFSRAGMNVIATREPLIEPVADIRADSLDYYASIRSFYLQSRKREIDNGRTSFEDLPDIGDFEEFDEETEE